MELGTLLLKLRKERRLSQAEVADRVGVSQSAYCAWESDRATPGARHYGPLAILFSIDIHKLIPAGLPAGLPAGCPPDTTPLSLANGRSGALQEVLITTQQETIALQKQRIKHLEAENQQLRRLTEASKLAGSALAIITSLLDFSSFLLESISEPIVAG